MPNKTAEQMTKAIIAALSELPDDAVKLITCGRGTEFAGWQKVEEALNCDVFLPTLIVLGIREQTKISMVF